MDKTGRNGHHLAGQLTPGQLTPGQLTPDLVAQVQTALKEVGEYGEVHLVVVKGAIRFVRTLKSADAPPDFMT